MAFQAARRQLFRNLSGNKSQVFRPPWAVTERLFLNLCTDCDNCIQICPENILVKDKSHLPSVDFSLGGCDFCGECVDACKNHALSKTEQPKWLIKAKLSHQCIEYTGTYCHVCQDACTPNAISFKPQTGGFYHPVLNQSLCNGCGACFKGCPTRAIEMVQLPKQETNL